MVVAIVSAPGPTSRFPVWGYETVMGAGRTAERVRGAQGLCPPERRLLCVYRARSHGDLWQMCDTIAVRDRSFGEAFNIQYVSVVTWGHPSRWESRSRTARLGSPAGHHTAARAYQPE